MPPPRPFVQVDGFGFVQKADQRVPLPASIRPTSALISTFSLRLDSASLTAISEMVTMGGGFG